MCNEVFGLSRFIVRWAWKCLGVTHSLGVNHSDWCFDSIRLMMARRGKEPGTMDGKEGNQYFACISVLLFSAGFDHQRFSYFAFPPILSI